MKRRGNYEQGLELVGEYEQSGESRIDFCVRRGLALCTLERWQRRVRRVAGGQGLLEVNVNREPASAGVLRISWPCGVQVEVESAAAGAIAKSLALAPSPRG